MPIHNVVINELAHDKPAQKDLVKFMIDLHLHSTCSDGSDTPTQIVEKAARLGLTALALTDHDTTAGTAECMAAAEKAGILAVSGVELSADYSPGVMHILGYFIDTGCAALQEELARVRNGREERNQMMLRKLNELGYELTWEEITAQAGSDVVGRPHFAAAIVEKGYLKSKSQVFSRLLGNGCKAYADRYRTDPKRSIELIRQAGGVPVLAHPASLKMPRGKLRKLIASLKKAGLEGLEVFHPQHNDNQIKVFKQVAQEFKLVMTGGTDCHGTFSPDIKIGRGFGDMDIPDFVYYRLKERMPEAAG